MTYKDALKCIDNANVLISLLDGVYFKKYNHTYEDLPESYQKISDDDSIFYEVLLNSGNCRYEFGFFSLNKEITCVYLDKGIIRTTGNVRWSTVLNFEYPTCELFNLVIEELLSNI